MTGTKKSLDPLKGATALLKAKDKGLGTGDLAHELLRNFNGIEGLARECKLEYEACKPGGMTRVMLLKAIVEYVSKSMERNQESAFANMGDEELEEAAEQMILKIREAV